jgi:hypothetical protein
MTKVNVDKVKVHPRNVKSRPIGIAEGEFRVPKEFSDPLPEEIIEAFYGESEDDSK